jgi:hypothetical protein
MGMLEGLVIRDQYCIKRRSMCGNQHIHSTQGFTF